MANNKQEIWKSLPGVPRVEVSTFGRVRTLDRTVPRKSGTYHVKGRVLKPWDNGDGYMLVHIPIDGNPAKKLVHRLVAQTFIPNPDSLPEVNHKDNDRANNHVDNLEFCTRQYNIKYRQKYGISNTETIGRPLFAIDLNTMEVSRFRSQNEAGRELGVSAGNICSVIKGRYKSTGGYWFVNDDGHAVDAINRKLQDIKKIFS